MSPVVASVSLASLATMPCWVAWQTEDRIKGRPTKVPYAPDGRKARADAPKTWGIRMEAEAMAAKLPKPYGLGGVGLEFHHLGDGRRYGGVDLDSCRDPVTGKIEDWAADVVARFDSYCEVSPSQTGLKIFFVYDSGDLPTLRAAMNGADFGKQFKRGGGDHPSAIEFHLGNRYFAVTDQPIADSPTEFRQVDTAVLLKLINDIGPAFAGSAKDTSEADQPKKKGQAPTDRSRSAIAFRKGKELRRAGVSFQEMVKRLLADPETADWTREKGTTESNRELKRIWDKAAASGPIIRVIAGELHKTATAAEDALIASGLPIYQRGDGLVQPVTREVPASGGRMTMAAGLGDMNVYSLVDVMCATAEYEKYDARSEDWVRINPPTQVAQILLSRQGKWCFPVIAGIITTPTLRPDGSLLTAPGYDPATRLYHVADPSLRLHPAVHAPTRKNAEDALEVLKSLLQEFTFVKLRIEGKGCEVAKAVALSGMITPVVRGAMQVAPLHGVNAHAPGSGKTFLVDLVSLIATGRPCPVISAAPDEAETEKRIAGLLLAGYPLISIDNCNGELRGDLLCQAIERPLIRIRRLGASDIIEIENSATLFATGNNLRTRGDLVRRSVGSELDPQVERPDLREFKHDPVATILADRGRFVSACLIIVRAYILAGQADKLTPPIASFEVWSGLVRSALVWLGCDDPALSMETARADDPELVELREMIGVWNEAFGTAPTTCKVAITAALDRIIPTDADGNPNSYAGPTELRHPELHKMLLQIAGIRGVVDANKLGRWLLAREGRIVGKERFQRDGITSGSLRWKLQELK